jgi:hypothetical protein
MDFPRRPKEYRTLHVDEGVLTPDGVHVLITGRSPVTYRLSLR